MAQTIHSIMNANIYHFPSLQGPLALFVNFWIQPLHSLSG